MRRKDYFHVLAHHRTAEALDEYLPTGGLESVDSAGARLTGRALTRRVVPAMIQASGGGGGAPAIDLLPRSLHGGCHRLGDDAGCVGR